MSTVSEIVEIWRKNEKSTANMDKSNAYQKRAWREVKEKGYYTASPLYDDKMEHPFSIFIHPLPKALDTYKLFHNHDFFELVYVYRGQCFNCVKDYEINLKEGDLLLLNPNALHCLYTCSETDVIFNFLISAEVFDHSFLSLMSDNLISNFIMSYLYQMRKVSDYLIIDACKGSPLYGLLDNLIVEYFGRLPGYEVILEAGLAQCFAYMARNYSVRLPIDTDTPISSRLYSILLYVYKHYATVTLKEVAYTFAYNEKYLSREIHRELGIGFSDLLKKIRLVHAEELLQKSSLTIEQIAQHIGYRNLTHFYKIFSDEYHTTPAEYRKSSAIGPDTFSGTPQA